MTSKQESKLYRSLRHWTRRALLMDRIGDKVRNRECAAKARAIESKIAMAQADARMAKLESPAFIKQFRVIP